MRFREFLQLIGLGRGIRFYETHWMRLALADDCFWTFPIWKNPKPNHDLPTDKEVNFYKKILQKGEWAIDVGAHIGDSTVPLAIACGSEGGVIAFEPNPITFHILSLNAILNKKVGRILPVPLAVIPEDESSPDTLLDQFTFDYGDHWLSNGGDHHGISRWRHGSAYTIPVTATTLDKFLSELFPHKRPKIAFIKLDCEGMDLAILAKLVRSFGDQQCAFQWEVIDNEWSREIIQKTFKDHEYQIYLKTTNHDLELFPAGGPTGNVINLIATHRKCKHH